MRVRNFVFKLYIIWKLIFDFFGYNVWSKEIKKRKIYFEYIIGRILYSLDYRKIENRRVEEGRRREKY